LYLLPCWCNVERTSVVSAWSWATSIVLYLSIRLCSAIHPLSHSMPGTTWYQSQRGTSSGPARSGLRAAASRGWPEEWRRPRPRRRSVRRRHSRQGRLGHRWWGHMRRRLQWGRSPQRTHRGDLGREGRGGLSGGCPVGDVGGIAGAGQAMAQAT
jgi:hypothetical protein